MTRGGGVLGMTRGGCGWDDKGEAVVEMTMGANLVGMVRGMFGVVYEKLLCLYHG